MKLYHHPLSPNARRPRLVVRHLGLDVEEVLVDLMSGAHHKPEYLALNPTGRVPTLVDGDFVLWESNAIASYLAEGTELAGKDRRERADILRWQCWGHAHWGPPIATLVMEKVIKAWRGAPPDAAKVAESEPSVHANAKILDAHLSSRTWVAGDRVTLADFALAPQLGFMQPAGLPLESYTNILAWFARVQALPAWQATNPPAPPR
jgi:glutathione S-transferase